MDPLNGPHALDLSRPQGIVLQDARLVSMSAVDVMDGGLHDTRCRMHLRIIDVARGRAWYVPLSDQQVAALHKATEVTW